ncbi:cytochrome P450 4V2 [Trichonephila clavipes]|nr:cytochrome P450 4V2 [Trichonephila clavipes]
MDHTELLDANKEYVSSFLLTVVILSLLLYFIRFYIGTRHVVKYANKLPSLKLRFYHILGHVSLLFPHRFNKRNIDISPHVYDLLALIGYNSLFLKNKISNIWQIYYPFVSIYHADTVEVVLNHSTELKKAWFYELLHPWIGTGLLTSEYDEETLSRKTVFQWFKSFREGHESYSNVMKCLLTRIHRVRPHLAASGKWFLLHDNARPHLVMCVRRFLAQQQLFHPPYSPDLAPKDFFLFPLLILGL